MKKTLLFSTLLLTLFACNISTDQDYKAIAQDTCDCIQLFTKDLSPEMVEIIDNSNGDETKLQEGMMKHVTNNPTQGMKDVQALQGAENMEEMTVCMKKVEKKYNDVYTTLSEQEILNKLIEELEKMDGCESSIALLKMGMASM